MKSNIEEVVMKENKVQEYIKLKLLGCIDDKEKLLKEYSGEELKGTIGEFVRKKLDLTIDEYEKIREENDEIILLVKKYYNTEERKEGFGSIENFYKWYIGQEKKCCYCGIEEKKLKEYFKDENLQYKNARQRGKILEIERIVTATKEHNVYSEENCRLACYICNNAKSDFISAKNFKPIAKGISKFWIEQGISTQFNKNDAIWETDIKE